MKDVPIYIYRGPVNVLQSGVDQSLNTILWYESTHATIDVNVVILDE